MQTEREMAAEILMLKERLNRSETKAALLGESLAKHVSQLTEMREKLRAMLEEIEE